MTLFSKFDGGAAYTPNYSENILKDPPCVHLFGSSYAVIEGCRGVLSFAPGALLLINTMLAPGDFVPGRVVCVT